MPENEGFDYWRGSIDAKLVTLHDALTDIKNRQEVVTSTIQELNAKMVKYVTIVTIIAGALGTTGTLALQLLFKVK